MTDGASPIGGIPSLEDRYRIEELIGSGGMATVWRAQDEQLRRPVAIKVMSDALAADDEFLARFRREARTAAGLTHPNVVQIFDYNADGERPFLVMQYVDGGTLSQRIERSPLDDDEALALAGDLLSALGCIHDAGILHRDIKPANVLLSLDGRAHLTDFGIARPQDATEITESGELLGTLRFMAPELLEGAPASRQSDLYSLGLVLREAVADPPPAPLRPLLPRLTAKRPSRRPRSAHQALRQLARRASPADRARHLPPSTAADATDSTAVIAPRVAERRRPREIHVRVTPRLMLVGLLCVCALAIGALALAGDDGSKSGETASDRRPQGHSLSDRLDQLEKEVRNAGR